MGPRTGLDVVEKGKLSALAWNRDTIRWSHSPLSSQCIDWNILAVFVVFKLAESTIWPLLLVPHERGQVSKHNAVFGCVCIPGKPYYFWCTNLHGSFYENLLRTHTHCSKGNKSHTHSSWKASRISVHIFSNTSVYPSSCSMNRMTSRLRSDDTENVLFIL
jgi:hypothetical protein